MSAYEWILNILKYAGLVLAAASSIWSATNVESREAGGVRKLTRAGKVAIGLTLLGLLISVASNLLQDQLNAENAQSAAAKELARMNRIIISGQPLTQLHLSWTFHEVKEPLLAFLKTADGTMREDWQQAFFNVPMSSDDVAVMNSQYELFPFLNFLAHDSLDQPKTANVLAMIALDDGLNAVLPFGSLETAIAPPPDAAVKPAPEGAAGPVGVVDWEYVQRFILSGSFEGANTPILAITHDADVDISWNLDPVMFSRAIDRRERSVGVPAGLPFELKIVLFYDIAELPFHMANLVGSSRLFSWGDLWNEQAKAVPRTPGLFSASSIEFVPNGLTDEAVRYALKRVSQNPVLDHSRQPCRCKSLLLLFERCEAGKSCPASPT